MKAKRYTWKGAFAGWRPALVIALPIFILAMWFGIHQGYSDLGLFAVVIALAAFHVAGMTVNLMQKMREHRRKSEEALMPNGPTALGAGRSSNERDRSSRHQFPGR
jgi:ABC-type spermidine/putrescine transport system permease subunit II